MGIYTTKNLNKEIIVEEDINLTTLIQENRINIIFGDFDDNTFKNINEAFNIPIDNSNPSIYIYIRNKYIDGDSGKEIPHDCTVKLIKNDIYKYKGRKGVPFKVEPKPKLDVDYEIDRKDKNITIKFIKDNKEDILLYWNAEDNKKGRKIMDDVKNRMCEKYGVKLNGKSK